MAGTQQQYWSGQINFAGLGNGTDFKKLVDGLIKTEGFHKRRLEAWKKGWQDKSKELLALNKKVFNLQTVLKKMDTMGEFMGKTTSVSNNAVLSASASGDAGFDSHKVEVKQLAASDHWVSGGKGFDKLDSKVTTSNATFRFSFGGKVVEMKVAANTTLKQFINNLNNHKDLRGKVRASAINDGDTFHLKLRGVKLGRDNIIRLSNSGLPGLKATSFVNIQKARDALLKVDGFPPGADTWMRRSSNAISDALEGVTLNLKSAKPGTEVDVTIAHDHEKTKKTVTEFLKAMNEVRLHISKLTEVSTKTKVATKKSMIKSGAKGSILTGNYGVEMVSQRLKLAISSPGVGFNLSGDQADIYSGLAAIGITSDADSGSATFKQLKLDNARFDKALKENPEAVAALFITDHTVASNSSDFTPGAVVRGLTPPGKHSVKYTVTGGKITSATINGKAAKVSGWDITGKHESARGLGLTVSNQADGTYSGTINVRVGKIHELLDDVNEMAGSNGTLKLIEKNYKTIINNIDKKITREDKRIAEKERRLRLKFARLDATLGRYEKLQQSLRGQIAKLGK